MHGGIRSDEEKIELNGCEEKEELPKAGEEKAEKKRGEGDENSKVKSRDGQNVLQTETAKFIAEETVLSFSCEKRAEKGGSSRCGEVLGEEVMKVLLCLEAGFCETPGI